MSFFDKFIFFSIHHWPYVTVLFVLIILLFISEHRKSGKSLSPQQASLFINHHDAIVIDVRDKKEYQTGHIVNALNIPYLTFKDRISELEKHKQNPIILVCKIGQHAGMIAKMLNKNGFQNVTRLSGGMTEWRNNSLPVVKS